jgi:nucleoside-diphosphate-sugar epimerase
VEYLVGDLTDPDLSARLVRGADLVIHLAARAGGIGMQNASHFEVFKANRAVSDAVFTAAVDNRCPRLFLASSAVVYRPSLEPLFETSPVVGLADRPSGYAWSKVCDEVVAGWVSDTLEVMVGRFTNIYGPGGEGRGTVIHDLVRRAIQNPRVEPLLVWGDGSAIRSFIHVSDAARLIVDLALGAPPGVYNVDSGVAVTIAEVARLVAAETHPGLELRFDPDLLTGHPHRVLDIGKVRSLGFEPAVELSDGIASLAEFERNRAMFN